jgi:hypothetical protein
MSNPTHPLRVAVSYDEEPVDMEISPVYKRPYIDFETLEEFYAWRRVKYASELQELDDALAELNTMVNLATGKVIERTIAEAKKNQQTTIVEAKKNQQTTIAEAKKNQQTTIPCIQAVLQKQDE